MSYESRLREINKMPDDETRAREYARLEGQRHLEFAISLLRMANTGRFPKPEVVQRLGYSIETILAEAK